ncbi:MAG TPA: DMT family transporter [Candidatus Dormibacteraeota bacterium]|nr:DMT family transporter [Candidatus Dormibacteraeota bacterium]
MTAAPASRGQWALFAALGFFWGTSYLFIKIGVGSIPPFTLIAGRLGIGALLLAAVAAAARLRLPRQRRTWGHLLVMAVLNIVLPFTLITFGERSIESSLAAVLNSTVPLFTIVFAALAFSEEAVTVNRLLGLIVGFAGVVVVVGAGVASAGGGAGAGGSTLGELAMIGSSICYALGNVYARRNVRSLDPMVPALLQVGLAFLIAAGLAIVIDAPWTLRPEPQALGAVAWLGVFGSGLAYLVYFRLLKAWGPTRASLVAYLLPVVGIVAGWLVLGEAVDGRIVAGTALVVGGIALVNSRRGVRRLYGRAAPSPE